MRIPIKATILLSVFLGLSHGAHAARYRVERSYPQGGPFLGKETTIEFKLFRGSETTPLTAKDLLIEHEKSIHMMAVDSGFQEYLHVHPAEVSMGVWQVPVSINTAGAFRFYLQFLPDGEITTKTVVFDDRYVAKPDQIVPTSPVNPDPQLVFNDGEFGVTLKFIEEEPAMKKIIPLIFTVEKNGVPIPIGDLDDYLGAKMHIAAISSDKGDFVHAHPEEDGVVKTYFQQAGYYGVFMQYSYKGIVHTNQFAIQVKP